MFMMDYRNGSWQKPQIIPFQNMSLSPATSVLHYGQSIFEGLKAFKNEEGRFGLFRPLSNIQRMNKSAKRMCMPEIPEDLFMEALSELVRLDRDWIPTGESSSLYLRPVMFGIDEFIGVKASESYRFIIFASPVNAYYLQPVKVKVERHYTRAARGGTGMAKAAGNYAGSLYPARLGNQQGFDQLLWTDSKEHKFIEESGTMNVMFVIDGKLITPELSDTILDGVTRKSVLQLARDWGIAVEERRVSVEEVITALQENRLSEAFGCGTAATIAHIAAIGDDDQVLDLPPVENRDISNRLSKHFVDLKKFRIPDNHHWMVDLS
jgi:branched-chain amino acid aminotransferase